MHLRQTILTVIIALTGVQAAAAAVGQTSVARWKDNKTAAMSLIFDDSYTNHATIAIPALGERGLVGSFFINPGNYSYKACLRVWEQVGPAYGHEYDNHTMHHAGATDSAMADYEIGECARTIWALRPPGATKMQAFASGGGTTWNVSPAPFLVRYYCFNRFSSATIRTAAGDNAVTMTSYMHTAINTSGWQQLAFHSIDQGGLGSDYSIDSTQFITFIDSLYMFRSQLWVGGFVSVYQYQNERNSAQVSVLEATNSLVRLNLTSSQDSALYKEPLTLISEVPTAWDLCLVTQAGASRVYQADTAHKVMFTAIPKYGEIRLVGEPSPYITTPPVNKAVFRQERVVFSVQAMGRGISAYQWQKNGTTLTGAQAESLVVPHADRADSGALYRCIVTSSLGSDTSTAARLDVKAWTLLPGLVWEAQSALFTYPYTILSGKYLYCDWPSKTPAAGGQALYFFHLDQPGDYVVMGKAHAFATISRTLYVNIDAEPADTSMAWDLPIASGFQWRTASWRGTGTVDTNQFAPKVFSLTAGDHYLVLRSRDEKVKFDTLGVYAYPVAVHDQWSAENVTACCRYEASSGSFIYRLPGSGHAGPVPVLLSVYNAEGREITCLVNAGQVPGEYRIAWQSSNLASGIYVYKFVVGNTTRTEKLVISK
jgi:hypothetical protein